MRIALVVRPSDERVGEVQSSPVKYAASNGELGAIDLGTSWESVKSENERHVSTVCTGCTGSWKINSHSNTAVFTSLQHLVLWERHHASYLEVLPPPHGLERETEVRVRRGEGEG